MSGRETHRGELRREYDPRRCGVGRGNRPQNQNRRHEHETETDGRGGGEEARRSYGRRTERRDGSEADLDDNPRKRQRVEQSERRDERRPRQENRQDQNSRNRTHGEGWGRPLEVRGRAAWSYHSDPTRSGVTRPPQRQPEVDRSSHGESAILPNDLRRPPPPSGHPGSGRSEGARGPEGRAARRNVRREEAHDIIISRPPDDQGVRKTKKAEIVDGARPVPLMANYFKVVKRPDWHVYHHRVDFSLEETDSRIKMALVRIHQDKLGKFIFDGGSLYTTQKLNADPLVLHSERRGDIRENVEIKIRLVAELAPTDPMYLTLFNLIIKTCLRLLELDGIGRYFYDRHQAITLDQHHLELWPGFKTSMRNREDDILLEVELITKVLRTDNCLHEIRELMNTHHRDRDAVRDALVGTTVMTVYNRMTYRVDDIDWSITPSHTFDQKGGPVTFLDYYKNRYGISIRDHGQPLLVSRPKKRDLHRGMAGSIMLIPELCRMTGLSDGMRKNFNLMKALAQHTNYAPEQRVKTVQGFVARLNSSGQVIQELQKWGLEFQDKLVKFPGHVLPPQKIMFGNGKSVTTDEKYDWMPQLRSEQMYSTVQLHTWAVIVPSRNANLVEKLVRLMTTTSSKMKFDIKAPTAIRQIGNPRPAEYSTMIDNVMNDFRDKVQMLFVILPRVEVDTYAAVKKRACQQFGVPSQCFVAKHNDSRLMSVCTNMVIQMNAKLGGEPWIVNIPLKNTMLVGFDVHHCGKRKNSSFGALVATTSPTLGKYFSTVSSHSSMEELSEKMSVDFTKCLHAYHQRNGDLPDRIFMYRDGVSEGQLHNVNYTELKGINECLETVYTQKGKPVPKFSFTVVTKKINTRIFKSAGSGRPANPDPGSVVDCTITLPERYDFFLVSHHTRQGTVSPTAYHVLYDTQGLTPDKMQRLTYKLCHSYYNWTGPVAVPAPCQYAKKHAQLTGLHLGGPSHEKLAHKLYFL